METTSAPLPQALRMSLDTSIHTHLFQETLSSLAALCTPVYSRSHSGKEAMLACSQRSLQLNQGGLTTSITAILRGLLRVEIPRLTQDFLNQNH